MVSEDRSSPVPADPPSSSARGQGLLSRAWLEPALILASALVLNLIGNGQVSLWDRDEPRYAGCTREMMASGTWVQPTFNGEPFYHKPVLTYWLMRAAISVVGDNPFGARLPSALAGAAMCLAVWAWGRRMFGPVAARWAALVLVTAPIVIAESKLATTDAPLALWIVLAQWALWELSRKPSWIAALGFWACLGLTILTKGPVGPAVIGVSAVASWWWGGSRAFLPRLHWFSGLALFFAITAPWFVAIEVLSHGDFHRILIGDQVVRRAAMTMEAHPGFPGYYFAVTAVAFFPWSALIPASLVAGWSRRRERPEFAFLLGWIAGPLAMFEIAQTKLLHYYLPSYPALALLIGWFVAAVVTGEVAVITPAARRVLRLMVRGIGGIWIGGLAVGIFMLPSSLRFPCLAAALVAFAGVRLADRQIVRGRLDRGFARLGIAWGILFLLIGAWLLPTAESFRISVSAGNRLREVAKITGLEPVMVGFKPPGLIYQVGRPLKTIPGIDALTRYVDERGVALAALHDGELAYLQTRTSYNVQVLDVLKGFDIERFRNRRVVLALTRPPTRVAVAPSTPVRTSRP